MTSFPGFIPTGSTENQRGEIDWILILVFVLVFQFWQYSLLQKSAEAWRISYQNLEDDLQSPVAAHPDAFSAFGKKWKSPKPRVDYGANHQRERDAEALCIVGRERLLDEDFKKLRCE